jgi:ATP:ADP antiporter, AAA family
VESRLLVSPETVAAVDRESIPSRPSRAEQTARGGLKDLIAIRKGEWPLALLLCAYFFTVVTTFWILKPLKKGVFIGHFKAAGITMLGFHLSAAQGELIAKVANMVVAFGAAVLFTALSRRLRRQRLTYAFSALLGLAFLYFAWAARSWSGFEVWAFYLFGDLYSTLMVATFFAFSNDSVDSDTAKRLYGIVGLGGVAGGAFGSSIVAGAVKKLSIPGWMFVCLALGVVIVALAWAAARSAKKHDRANNVVKEEPKKHTDNAALHGPKLVFSSRYLLAIVAIVGLYEMVSTIMDFQFTSAVQKSLDAAAIPGHFAKVFAITNWAALIIQLLFTSFVMRRFGLTIALLVLPAAAALGSSAFLLAPTLITASALNTADNAFAYSINQSSKEVLYVPTTDDEKYAAKAFIDMFVQRFAKAIAVVLSLGISIWFASFNGIRYLSIATLVLLAIWGVAAYSAGKRFHRLEAERADATD